MAVSLLTEGLCLLLAFVALVHLLKPARSYKFPPGPRPAPLIGNVLQIPPKNPEVRFTEWAEEYGSIVYVDVFGQPTIILNTLQAAQELMEQRSSIYSDRPRFVLLSELMGWHNATTHVRYGPRFRRHRRYIHQTFNQKATQQLKPLQQKEVLTLIRGIMESAERFSEHIKRFSAATILKITYGVDVTSVDDSLVLLTEEATSLTVLSGTPAATLVDYFPLLRYIPIWAPFSQFKRDAAGVKVAVDRMMNTPFGQVKEDMRRGDAPPSMTLSLLQSCIDPDGILHPEDEEVIKGVAGTLLSAASETTVAVLDAFILAMVLFPDVQKKAQEEMDMVKGDTLPNLGDEDSLPFLACLVKETYRWCCPVPLGIPHRVMRDDFYSGYTIPEGSTVMSNIYAMSRNCSQPDEFIPERFMEDSSLPDPRDLVFGFGRRRCPGRYFADRNVWLVAASIIATLQISKATDDQGVSVTPEVEFITGFIRRPIPYKCHISPRSRKKVEIVHRQMNLGS